MKKSEMLVLLVACLMFAVGMPTRLTSREATAKVESHKTEQRQEQQAEEYDEEENGVEQIADDSYQISYKSKDVTEDKIVDIIWLKKAAKVALDAGVPYFNVVQQKTRREPVKGPRRSRPVVEGRIKLDNDAMASEYDANEIMSLVLTDRP